MLTEATAMLLAGLASAGASIGGTIATNRKNQQLANENTQFNVDQNATKYQTVVEDLRKAGLSPALAYGGSPTAVQATYQPSQNPFEQSNLVGFNNAVDKILSGELKSTSLDNDRKELENEQLRNKIDKEKTADKLYDSWFLERDDNGEIIGTVDPSTFFESENGFQKFRKAIKDSHYREPTQAEVEIFYNFKEQYQRISNMHYQNAREKATQDFVDDVFQNDKWNTESSKDLIKMLILSIVDLI